MPILYMLIQFLEVPAKTVSMGCGVLAGALMPSSKQDQSIHLSGLPGLCINCDQVDNICTDCSNFRMTTIWNLTGTTTKAQARACIHEKQLGLIGGSSLTMHIYPGNMLLFGIFILTTRTRTVVKRGSTEYNSENCLIWLTSHTHTHTHIKPEKNIRVCSSW